MFVFHFLGELLKKDVTDKIYYIIGNQIPVSDPNDEFISGEDYIAVLPPGNYNEPQLATVLNNVLRSQNKSLS